MDIYKTNKVSLYLLAPDVLTFRTADNSKSIIIGNTYDKRIFVYEDLHTDTPDFITARKIKLRKYERLTLSELEIVRRGRTINIFPSINVQIKPFASQLINPRMELAKRVIYDRLEYLAIELRRDVLILKKPTYLVSVPINGSRSWKIVCKPVKTYGVYCSPENKFEFGLFDSYLCELYWTGKNRTKRITSYIILQEGTIAYAIQLEKDRYYIRRSPVDSNIIVRISEDEKEELIRFVKEQAYPIYPLQYDKVFCSERSSNGIYTMRIDELLQCLNR